MKNIPRLIGVPSKVTAPPVLSWPTRHKFTTHVSKTIGFGRGAMWVRVGVATFRGAEIPDFRSW
jgi:hypothetical protein